MPVLKLRNGNLRYKSKSLYLGIKPIDKVIAKENLLLFNQLLTNSGVKFGLLYGTLLGAIREHDFIAHDEDIDLFILNEDRLKFLDLLFVLKEHGYELVRYDRRDLYSIERKGEYMDVYVFSELDEDIRICSGLCMWEPFLVNTCWIEFLGSRFIVPKEYIKYLEFEYGKNWNTPILYTDFNISKVKRFMYTMKEKMKEFIPDWLYLKILSHRDEVHIRNFQIRLKDLIQ